MPLNNNRRIAINSVVLYIRVIFTLFLTLFSTRFVLLGLGEDNFGTYNLIAGVVALFSFISGTMAATTQRFISYEFGKTHDIQQISKVFNTSFKLHLIIAAAVVIIILVGGILLIDNVLSIPENNRNIAKIVLLSVAIGLIATILSVPYEATLMAHENILFFAIIQSVGVVLKFSIALLLLILDSNKLITYSILMAIVPFIILSFQAIYCYKKYPETHLNKVYMQLKGNNHISKMSSFATYALFGSIGWTIRTQGISIILNIFWGVAINAANGIANQVSAALLTLSNSLTTSIRPQLIQAAGEKNYTRMMQLTMAACRYPLIILSILGIPLFICMPYALELWLKEVPQFSILFCRILILDVMLNQSSLGLALIMDAKGEIRMLHTVVGLSLLITTAVVFFVAKYSNSIPYVYCLIILNDIIIVIARIIIVKYYITKWDLKFDLKTFVFSVLLKPFAIIAFILTIGTYIWQFYESTFSWNIIMSLGALLIYLILGWFLILTEHERKKISTLATKFININR